MGDGILMARGRKPALDNVSVLPLHDEPQAVHIEKAKQLRPDDLLLAAELKVYDRIAPQLAMLGRLKPHFIDALCEFCRVTVSLADNRKYFRKSGETYKSETRNGVQIKSRPEVAQFNVNRSMWRSLVGEFGLAPAAEKGMQSGQGDLFDDFDKF